MSYAITYLGLLPTLFVGIIYCLIRGAISHRKEISNKRNLKNG